MSEKSVYEELKRRVRDLEKIVTDRRRTDERVLDAAEKYRIHFSLANDVIYTIDRNLVVTSVSPSVERVLGYRPDELVGRKLHDVKVIPPEYHEKALDEIVRVLEGERISASVYRFITKDGSTRYGEVSGVPFVRNGKAREIISVARDITDRIEMERSLRESEERFRTIFESARDCIYIKNLDLEYVFVNPCMEKVLGLPAGEIVGRKDGGFFMDGHDARSIDAGRSVLAGNVVEGECSRHVDGEVLTFHVVEFPMRDSLSRITGLCGMARDITDRKRFEEQLLAKERELAHQARYLEEMNITLKVLLDSREKEKRHAREVVVSRARKLVYPYLEKMEACSLDDECRLYLNIVRANLDDILDPPGTTVSQQYLSFTPMEMRIADLIKQGKSTKEIASILGVSPFAVSFHRTNMRKKCGLLNEKKNLRTYLNAMDRNG